MKYYSTNGKSSVVSAREATISGLASDGGLFMPKQVPVLSGSFFSSLRSMSLQESSFTVLDAFFGEDVPKNDLLRQVESAFSFPCPLKTLDKNLAVLELFHGPTLAFKDFGARMMAQLLSYFWQSGGKEVTILVATSGDTGSAVAHGFYELPGIKVVLLYPSGKVSDIQEKQFTTLGKNIQALEVSGTFDDCQRMVKAAFVDKELTAKRQLASANSINIARLIPQSCYYFEACKQTPLGTPPVFCVPCGNFGNLTAGLIAARMGLPVKHFVAANNANDVVKLAFDTGKLTPRRSIQTISNAMDVGNPSNFDRMLTLYENKWDDLRRDITATAFDDQATLSEMKRVYQAYNYVADPHTAVGLLGLTDYLKHAPQDFGIVVSTAHPAKFIDTTRQALGFEPEIPERLKAYLNKTKLSIPMTTRFEDFKSYLMK